MIATTLTENLSRALSIASRFTGGKVQLPVLANILVKAEKNKLIICATNLESSVSVSIGAKIEAEGEITVPGKVISDLVNSLPPGQVVLKVDQEKLQITNDTFSSVLLGMNASDYPSIPMKSENAKYSLKSGILEKTLKKILFSVSTDETRPVLTGVLIVLRNKQIDFVSTDGFRLSFKKMPTEDLNVKADIQKLIVPKNVLVELLRISEEGSSINFSFNKDENQVMFEVGDCVLTSRIIQGDFPDFERIIPKSPQIAINSDREELLRSVKLASVFARDAAGVIRFQVQNGKLIIAAESPKSGNQSSTVDIKQQGDGEIVIAYNYRFLEEWLNSVDGEDVEVKLTDANVPGLFLDPKDSDYLHIIMPIKLTS